MSLYTDFQKNKKKSTGGLYGQFLTTKQPKVSTGKKILSFGNEIAKGLVKTPARIGTNLINTGQIAAGKEKTQPLSNKWLGEVKPIGQEGNFANKLLDSAGVGVELASYIPMTRALGTGFKFSRAALAKVLPGLITEGAFGGLLGTTGSEFQKKAATGEDISGKNILYGTAGGAILNPLIGLLGRGAGNLMDDVANLKNMKYLSEFPDVLRKLNVDEGSAGSKIKLNTPRTRLKAYSDKMGYEPIIPDADLPTIDFGGKPKSDLPTIRIDEPNYGRPLSEYSPLEGARTILDNGKKSKQVLDMAVPDDTPPVSKTPLKTIRRVDNQVAEAPRIDSTQKMPVREVVAPNSKIDDARVERIVNKANETFESQTNKQQIQAVLAKDLDEVTDIALGRKNSTDNIPNTAHYAVLKDMVDNQRVDVDVDLVMKLADSPVASKSGQALQANKISRNDTLVDIIKDTKNKLEAKKSKTAIQKRDFEVNNATKEIIETMNKFKKMSATREMIVDAINKITC